MRPAAVILLAGACLAAPSPLVAEEGRFVIIQTDGTKMTLAAPPERKGEKFLGRLMVGGQLVSFPVAEVDQARTEAANRTPTPAPPKDQGQVLKSSPPRSTETSKLKVSREEAERSLAGSSGTATASSYPPPAPPGKAKGSSASGVVDQNGHGEAWWNRKASPILSRISKLEGEKARADSKRDEHQRSPGFGTPAWTMRLHKLTEAADKVQVRLDEERRKLDRLSEDARRAGAYPGWLR